MSSGGNPSVSQRYALALDEIIGDMIHELLNRIHQCSA